MPTILPEAPIPSFEEYVLGGGGQGLRRALAMDPLEVVAEVTRSGLRGRGGAGFPTGVKWGSVRDSGTGMPTYFVCNGAEGEPGTFKDRTLLYRNPYQVLEGVLIASYALGARAAYIGVKERFTRELGRLAETLEGAAIAGWEGVDTVQVVPGPDEYLFGEEKAMLEVIERKLPFPRILPPYVQGLFATMASPNPTAVNNVETLSHVTSILTTSADEFRTVGTQEAPGTMVFTVVGDCASPGVYELPLGTPLRTLICDIAGACDVKAIYSGTSNPVLTPDLLDLPMDFDSFREAGVGLGSGGFVVYGQHRDIVQVANVLTRFLAIESCGQCLACKLGTMEISERLDRLVRGEGTQTDVEQIRKRCTNVTDGNRCYLPVGAALTVSSTLERFAGEFSAHLGVPSEPGVAVDVPKILDLDPDSGEVTYDLDYRRKQSDWSYAPPA
ncbi:MAG: NADH-ubiquinone oxidoreductase-F iron-sulfur binding region domain-containing protein [Egibacteraceae bacterium]